MLAAPSSLVSMRTMHLIRQRLRLSGFHNSHGKTTVNSVPYSWLSLQVWGEGGDPMSLAWERKVKFVFML